ncbi:MAG: histidine--tRNA ligase [Thermofilaceae archaeon]
MRRLVPYDRPRGTRDYFPEESDERRLVIEKLRHTFELYGYGEVITPAFEHLELLVAKAGEDVINQIYWFKDKGGRELGLRFELTTPIARIVAENPSLSKPIRFYYIQPVWRYEEPQKGRLREFWQAGIELIGVPDISADAEVIALLVNSLRKTGLKNYCVHINDRLLIEHLLAWARIPPDSLNTAFRVIDKLEKKGVQYVADQLSNLSTQPDRIPKLLELLTSSDITQIEKLSLTLEARESIASLNSLISELENAYGLADYVQLDLSVVRGLDYYTSLVYEVKTPIVGELGSIAGGGRYDDLIRLVGGPQLPATGMAIGIERLIECLRKEGVLPFRRERRGVMVIPIEQKYRYNAISIAEKLRNNGITTVVELSSRKLSTTLEVANKRGFRYALIIGKTEIEKGFITIKDLELWKEEKTNIEDFINIYSKVVL